MDKSVWILLSKPNPPPFNETSPLREKRKVLPTARGLIFGVNLRVGDIPLCSIVFAARRRYIKRAEGGIR